MLTPMVLPIASPGRRAEACGDLLLACVPVVASLALSLPHGLLMPYRLVVAALALLAVWSVASRVRIAAPRTLLAVLGVSGVLGIFGLVGWARFHAASADDAGWVVALLALAASAAVLSSGRRTATWLVYGWLLAGALSAAVLLWERLTGQSLPRTIPPDESVSAAGNANLAAGLFDNPNLLAYQCSVVLLLLPAAWSALPRPWRHLLVPFGAGLLAIDVWTQGRLAVVAVLAGLALWALRSAWGRVTLGAAVLGFALASWLKVAFAERFWAEAANALIEFDQVGASSWVRLELARSGWWILEQSTYLGVGPGGFEAWSVRADNPFRYEQLNNAHSGPIEILSEYGLIGSAVVLAALVAVVVLGLRASVGRPRWDADRTLAYAAMLLAGLWPLLSSTHSTWQRQPLAAAHVATIVALIAWTERQRSGSTATATGDPRR